MPRVPQQVLKDGNRSGARIGARDGSAQPKGDRRPVECVSVSVQDQQTAPTYLGVSRIGVEHVREELACTSDAGNHKAMDVVAIDDKKL